MLRLFLDTHFANEEIPFVHIGIVLSFLDHIEFQIGKLSL